MNRRFVYFLGGAMLTLIIFAGMALLLHPYSPVVRVFQAKSSSVDAPVVVARILQTIGVQSKGENPGM